MSYVCSIFTFSFCYIGTHTYVIGHYKPSVRIFDLVSHTIYVVCVNFIHKWWDLQFKFDSERQIFWETFHANFFTLSFCQKSAERKSRKKYFSYFVLITGPGTRILDFRLISQTLLTRPRRHGTQVCYICTYVDNINIWIVSLLLTDKKVSRVLVSSSKKWIKEIVLSFL